MVSYIILAQEHPILALSILIIIDVFFGVIPVEINVSIGTALKLPPLLIGLLGSTFSTIGATIDYSIGRGGIKLLRIRGLETSKKIFNKYGGATIFLVRLLPLPSKSFSLIAGSVNYSIVRFVLSLASGSFLRYYLEARALEPYGEELEKKVLPMMGEAIAHASDVSRYVVTLAFVAIIVAAYFVLTAIKNKNSMHES